MLNRGRNLPRGLPPTFSGFQGLERMSQGPPGCSFGQDEGMDETLCPASESGFLRNAEHNPFRSAKLESEPLRSDLPRPREFTPEPRLCAARSPTHSGDGTVARRGPTFRLSSQ